MGDPFLVFSSRVYLGLIPHHRGSIASFFLAVRFLRCKLRRNEREFDSAKILDVPGIMRSFYFRHQLTFVPSTTFLLPFFQKTLLDRCRWTIDYDSKDDETAALRDNYCLPAPPPWWDERLLRSLGRQSERNARTSAGDRGTTTKSMPQLVA